MNCTKSIFTTLVFAAHLFIAPMIQANEIDQEYLKIAESFKNIGETDKAIAHYKDALKINPNLFQAAFNLGALYYQNKKTTEAIDYYQKAVAIQPTAAEALYNLGVCLVQAKRPEEAVTQFQQVTSLKPNHAKAYLQLATIFQEKKQTDNAINAYEQAVTHDPTLFDAQYTLGRLKREQNKFDEAITCFRKAKDLNGNNPALLLDLANTLNMMEFEHAHEALDLYKNILEISPNSIAALYNFGYTLKKLGHIEQAVAVYDKVLAQQPDYALARFSRSVSYLALGDFERGWPEYESRWSSYSESPKKFNSPLWDGSNPAGKRILIYAEQGLGDTLQFVRYAKVLKDKGAYVIFVTQKALKDLLSQCPYIDELYIQNSPTPPVDMHCALMSLPMILKTRVDTVPINIPYLHPDPTLVNYWQEKLSSDKNFKIGICWQGNAHYSTQFLRQAVAAKSTTADLFAPIAQIPGVSVYSLQKLDGSEQLNKLPAGVVIREFGNDFDETHGRFMDTAAIMNVLDLIITIDTSICHCAGGLGVPVWNLLPQPADWRWMLNTNETPWYPNMRLFRQQTPGDWQTLMQTVQQELQILLNKSAQQNKVTPHANNTPPFALSSSKSLPDHSTELPSINSGRTGSDFSKNASHPTHPAEPKQNHELDLLNQQLQQANNALAMLEKQLFDIKHTAITDQYAELARKAYYAHNEKKYIWNKIRALSNTIN